MYSAAIRMLTVIVIVVSFLVALELILFLLPKAVIIHGAEINDCIYMTLSSSHFQCPTKAFYATRGMSIYSGKVQYCIWAMPTWDSSHDAFFRIHRHFSRPREVYPLGSTDDNDDSLISDYSSCYED